MKTRRKEIENMENILEFPDKEKRKCILAYKMAKEIQKKNNIIIRQKYRLVKHSYKQV